MQEKSTRSPRRKTTVRQRWLPIDAAPPKVREHGLRDAHSRPLVSRGKIGGVFSGSFRVSPVEAWTYPSLELRAANSFTIIVLDCDGYGARGRIIVACEAWSAPPVNWMTKSPSGGCHAVWCLKTPVHRGATAREKPLKLLGRVSEYLSHVVEADEGYAGVLTHNPMEEVHGSGWKTHWWRREPYTLGELAEFIPFRWRKPKPAKTAIGRNCDIFAHCMRWAGSPANLAAPVLEEALTVNDGLKFPLGTSEAAGIARSVERYRRRWIKRGQFGPVGDAERTSWGRERGKKSGQARRKRTQERDRAIVQLALAGESNSAIARVIGVNEKMVRHVLRRDVPLFGRPAPLTETRPWEAEGISRSTWERRRRDANSERTKQVVRVAGGVFGLK